MEIVVRIPVKPHLKKFLHAEWGDQLRLTKRSPLARIMFSYLGVSTRKKQIGDKQTTHYEVVVPISYFTRHKVSTITEEGMLELSLWFDEYFTRLMKEYVSSRIEMKQKEVLKQLLEQHDKRTAIQVSESLADFLRKYGITEEELPLETAQKRYTRSKNKRGILI